MKYYSLEEALVQPQNVYQLVLSDQELKRIPAVIWQRFPHLELLDLSHNLIKRIPAGLRKLTQLRRLHLSHNRLAELDEELSLPLLKHLDVSHNHIKAFGADLPSLETLDLSSNKLKSLPTILRQNDRLLHLNISQNKLKELPDLQVWFPRLRWLAATHCVLTAIEGLPEQAYALLLAYNKLSTVPRNWGQLADIQRLEISSNRLAIELQHLKNKPELTYLDVRRTTTRWPGVEALLLHLPQLGHSHGGLSKKLQHSLAQFLRAVPPTQAPQRRALLWQLWQGYAGNNVPTELLWSCLHQALPAIIRIGAYYELLRRLPAKYGQLSGRKWWIAGTVSTPVKTLKERLQVQRIRLAAEPAEATGIILGHTQSTPVQPPQTELPVFGERELLLWLDRKEGRHLTQTKEEDQLVNLEHKLRAKDPATFRLAIRLLEAQGTPQRLLGTLLTRWLQASPDERREWEYILLPYLPGDLKIALEEVDNLPNQPTRRGFAGSLWKVFREMR